MRAWALLAAFTAAATVPHQPPGANFPAIAVLVAAAVSTVVVRTPTSVVLGMLALALTLSAAWLDAAWIVALDLASAAALATLAVAGIRLGAPLAPLRALADAPTLLPKTPFAAAQAFRGVVFGGLLALPFGVLFWTGDAAFAQLGSDALPQSSSLPLRVFVFGAVLAAAVALALAARRGTPAARTERTSSRLALLEWAIPLALLDALFLVFVLVQLAVLFGGHDHVLATAGLTYAEYARQGFWQLIAACALTFAVIATTVGFARVTHRRELLLRDVLLGTLVLLTLVVVASAVHRLRLYESAYGLTRSRLAAESFCFALAAFLVLLACARFVRPMGRHFPPVVAACAAVSVLAFSLLNPDARVAERNVARWRDTGKIDLAYLQGLSADAVPALATLPDPLRTEVLAPYRDRLRAPEAWTSANVSRRRARALLS